MDVLSSRVLIRPSDLAASTAWYRDVLGLAVVREFGGGGQVFGTVFALGGGALELSGSGGRPGGPDVRLWLQVRDASTAVEAVRRRGGPVVREVRREPWGLVEGWVADPDGVQVALVEVPDDHPLRRRVD